MVRITIDITGMSVKQLHDALAIQIAEGRADYTVWRPASVHPAAVRDIIIDSEDQHILIK